MPETNAIEEFWNAYLATLPENEREQKYFEAAAWGNSDELADTIAELIYSGVKTTTSSLLWSQQAKNWTVEKPGDKSILLDSKGLPICITETVDVFIKPFDQVDAAFVYNYGEGDRTLNFWNQNVWDYYDAECTVLGKSAARDMPMICQVFRVIYKGSP